MKSYKIFSGMILTLMMFVSTCFFGLGITAQNASAEEINGYSLDELLQPVWEGEISYQESVLPVMEESNTTVPVNMLYPIKKVLKVQNASLTITYQENVDYIVDNGQLLILKSGNIPIMMHRELFPSYGQSGFEAREGGYIYFSEGDYFHSRQIVVTYTHEARFNGYKPESKAHLLNNIHTKLANKEDINLFVFGDSISVGGNASGFLNVAPYLPTYSELFAEGIKRTYGVNVHMHNASVGGKDSAWGAQTIEETLNKVEAVDLAIVAFGMNDGHLDGTMYATNVDYIHSKIQEKYPDADILMVATMLPNYDAINFYKNQETFHTYLSELETDGVALANMTSVHKALLNRKKYVDMTGNNVNHANDYMSRVYAQTLLTTLAEKTESDTKKSKENLLQSLLSGCVGSVSVLSCVGILCFTAWIQIYRKED